MPRKGMQYERCVMIIANPYTEDTLKKYNSVEMLLPKTGDVVFLTKLPQSLYTPGDLCGCLFLSFFLSFISFFFVYIVHSGLQMEGLQVTILNYCRVF